MGLKVQEQNNENESAGLVSSSEGMGCTLQYWPFSPW